MNKLYSDFPVGATMPDIFATVSGNATAFAPDVFFPPITITGRALGRMMSSEMTVAQRAIIAASIVEGGLPVKNVTFGQLARLSGISRSSLDHARNLSADERCFVLLGDRPLVRPQDQAAKSARKHHYTTADVMQVVDAFGPDIVMGVLDMLTMPKAA